MAKGRRQKLYRVEDGLVGGVCAGIAECFDMDVIAPRILAVLIALSTFGVGAVVYVILWVKLPVRTLQAATDPYDIEPDHAEAGTGSIPCAAPSLVAGDLRDGGQRSTISLVARVATGVSLSVLFLVVAAMVPPFIPGTQPWELWPVAGLIAGVFLVIVPVRSSHEMAWHVIGIVVTSFSALALPMSLDIVSWYTVPRAFQMLWFLVAAGVIMLVIGIVRNEGALMVGGAVCLAAFCLFTLLFLSIPGEAPNVIVVFASGGPPMGR